MPKITIELEVDQAQELASTIRTTVRKIDWVLENKPPKKVQAVALDERAKLLTKAAVVIEKVLNARALNVVKLEKQSGQK